jgi:hypothetical protein
MLFCHNAEPRATYSYASPASLAPLKPIRNDPVVIGAIVLVSILVVGVVVAALLAAPSLT